MVEPKGRIGVGPKQKFTRSRANVRLWELLPFNCCRSEVQTIIRVAVHESDGVLSV